jgi:hypothetical protein
MNRISTSTKERLLAKLKNKSISVTTPSSTTSKNVNKIKDDDIGNREDIIILPKKVKSVGLNVIIKKSEYLDFEKNEAIDVINNHRLYYIKNLVEKQSTYLNSLSENELENKKKEIVVAVHDAWIDQYMENACIIDVSDRRELIDSKIVHYYNHRVVILNYDVKDIQVDIEYQGLCLLRELDIIQKEKSEYIEYYKNNLHPLEYNFLKYKSGCDIIVHRNSWKYFLCMQYGIDFYNVIIKDKTMMKLYPNFSIYDVIVASKKYGEIKYPQQKEFENFIVHWIKFYPDWKSYKI